MVEAVQWEKCQNHGKVMRAMEQERQQGETEASALYRNVPSSAESILKF